jgi:metalloendopeptidase OMA1, mitochondrial
METEADHIGLLLMAKACYNPQAAVELWKRMKEGGPKVAEFASTHPSSESRIDFLKSHMPKALNVYHDSECFNNSIYLKDFFSK